MPIPVQHYAKHLICHIERPPAGLASSRNVYFSFDKTLAVRIYQKMDSCFRRNDISPYHQAVFPYLMRNPNPLGRILNLDEMLKPVQHNTLHQICQFEPAFVGRQAQSRTLLNISTAFGVTDDSIIVSP
jgi:hypothetical protein